VVNLVELHESRTAENFSISNGQEFQNENMLECGRNKHRDSGKITTDLGNAFDFGGLVGIVGVDVEGEGESAALVHA